MASENRNGSKAGGSPERRLVIVVDDDAIIAAGMVDMLEHAGYRAQSYGRAEDLFEEPWPEAAICLLLDESLPGMRGVEALSQLRAAGIGIPVVMITGTGDVPTAVAAMKAGASDFIEKPASNDDVLAAIDRALAMTGESPAIDQLNADAARFTAQLTPRQRQILDMIVEGCPNKIIASDLGISQRTVEAHRAEIMHKSGVKSLPALTRMMFASRLAGRPALTPPDKPHTARVSLTNGTSSAAISPAFLADGTRTAR